MITLVIGILFLVQTDYTAIGVLFTVSGVFKILQAILQIIEKYSN